MLKCSQTYEVNGDRCQDRQEDDLNCHFGDGRDWVGQLIHRPWGSLVVRKPSGRRLSPVEDKIWRQLALDLTIVPATRVIGMGVRRVVVVLAMDDWHGRVVEGPQEEGSAILRDGERERYYRGRLIDVARSSVVLRETGGDGAPKGG